MAKIGKEKKLSNIMIEDAEIRFRNFAGAAGKFNNEGRRSFCVLLDPETAEELIRDGWNVHWLKPRDEQEDEQAYMQVAVNFKIMPPKIVMITGQGKTFLDESNVNVLDWAEIETVDLIIRPYQWEVNGKTGVKGYVKSLYVTIHEDEFASKYYDVPENANIPIDEH